MLNSTMVAQIQSVSGSFQSVITGAGIIVGGLWAYKTYIRKRERYPRAEIKHDIFVQRVEKQGILLICDIIIHNLSEVLLPELSLELKINQMLPPQNQLKDTLAKPDLPDRIMHGVKLIDWGDGLASDYFTVPSIEPNETQQIHFDFLINPDVMTIIITSRFQKLGNIKEVRGWSHTTIHDLEKLLGDKKNDLIA